MRAILILVIVGALGYFGYQYFAAEDTASDVVNDTADAVNDAVEGAAETAEDVVDQATDAANDAMETVTDAADDAADTAASVADSAQSMVQQLLSLDGFDADKVGEMIANSDLSDTQKTTLTTVLEGAKDNPELLEGALQQIKTALGL